MLNKVNQAIKNDKHSNKTNKIQEISYSCAGGPIIIQSKTQIKLVHRNSLTKRQRFTFKTCSTHVSNKVNSKCDQQFIALQYQLNYRGNSNQSNVTESIIIKSTLKGSFNYDTSCDNSGPPANLKLELNFDCLAFSAN